MRLQVFLSQSGVCSRRAAVDLIKIGRVSVNKQIIYKPAHTVDPDKDSISFDGCNISLKKKSYILFNKPKGVVTTRKDKHAQAKVYSYIPKSLQHLYSVGRLDKHSQGLLVFTNDGELAHRLMHPKFSVDKNYIVKIDKKLLYNHKLSLERGIILDSKRTSPARIDFLSPKTEGKTLEFLIHEGRKRQIRRMLLKLGYRVVSLRRIAYGLLRLGNLAEGKWRKLTKEEVEALFRCVRMQL